MGLGGLDLKGADAEAREVATGPNGLWNETGV
jgi:hypothetical protein